MAKNRAVFGIYASRELADNAVNRLKAAGFRTEDMSIMLQDNVGTKDLGHEKHTKAPEETVRDGIYGAIIGGIIGGLIGAGVISFSFLSPLIVAGPVIGALTGVACGGFIGAVIGAFIGRGIPEYEAKRYKGRVKKGGVLLSVHCDGPAWEKKCWAELKQTGADGIGAKSEEKADFDISDKPVDRGTRAA